MSRRQTISRIRFAKAANRWTTLRPTTKECWCARARAAAAKCGCFDFFMRSQLNTFAATGSFDEETCPDCPTPVIIYSTTHMSINAKQGLAVVDDGSSPYKWEINAGGGQLSVTTGTSTLYTAPSSNPNCLLNVTIRVTNKCKKYADLKIAINAYVPTGDVAYFGGSVCLNATGPASGCAGTPWGGQCPPGTSGCIPFLSISEYGYNCQDAMLGGGGCNRNYEVIKCVPGDCLAETCCQALSTGGSCHGIYPGGVLDVRTQAMKDAGCCPAALS
jgi:hypothetical protein